MKITLGPYIHPFKLTFHKQYMYKKHGYCWDSPSIDDNGNEKPPYTPTKFEFVWSKIEAGINWCLDETINRIQNKRERKVKVKIHPYDAWNAFGDLALIILPVLKEVKKDKNGSPWVDDEDAPIEFSLKNSAPMKNEYDWDENVHKRWEYVIDEMIWTFEQIKDSSSDDKFFVHHETEYDINNINKWKRPEFNKEGYDKWNARKQNGLRLFGKYFQSLWT